MVQPVAGPRFRPGQRIVVTRSGHSAVADSLAEILQVVAAETAEVYRVRWLHGHETYFVPGPEAHDRRQRDVGPPPGVRRPPSQLRADARA